MKPEVSAYTIFNNALEQSDPAARAVYLNQACGSNAALRERVEKLLQAHNEAGGFFSQPLTPTNPVQSQTAVASISMEKAGDVIGRYKLLEQIGEGGCGVVYMAEQQQPVRRRVALKVIKLGMDTKQVVARFEAERQALALMDHPSIARVLDAGATDAGRPYFVMELVRGIRITEFCDQKGLSTKERLELFISVCRAVQHAHQKGIIHRDLKPSNILVTIVDGAPVTKVIDFGIAKATSDQRLTDKTLFTAFAQFVGTPAYMSPEQAEMSGVDTDTRTDIYSLGVVLYELLTGRTPFDAKALLQASIDEIRRTIREQEPLKPSTQLHILSQVDLTSAAQARHVDGHKLVQAVEGDLDWIVMKCLEKERGRRYETVNGLAADIRRHLNTEPVTARPPGRWYEFQKTVRRHKFGFAAATAVASVLLLGIAASTWQAIRATRAEREQSRLREGAERAEAKQVQLRQQADEARARAETAERDARQQLFNALLDQVRATVKGGELGQRVRALDALRQAAAISNTVELRREAFAALALPDLRFKGELLSGSDFTLVLLDPRFQRVALCRGRGLVEIRSASDHRLLTSLPASTNLMTYSGKWSDDGRFLAVKRDYESAGRQADVEVWEVGGARRALLLRDTPWGMVSFHPRLARVMATSRDGSSEIWSLENGTRIGRFGVLAGPSDLEYEADLKYSPDGKRFAVRHYRDGGVVSIYGAEGGAALVSQTHPRSVLSIDWHPSGRWIAATTADGTVSLIDSQSGEWRALGRHKVQAATAAFSPDGRYLITGGWEKELICWDLEAMQRAFTIPLGSYRLQFDSSGRECAVIIPGKSVQLHAFERSNQREFPEELGGRIQYVAFSQDGRWLAASGEKRAGVWDLKGAGPAALDESPYMAQFWFTPDGHELFAWRGPRATDSFRWRLRAAVPQEGPSAPPTLEPLPLYKPDGLAFLAFSSNAVVMTGSKGSQVLAPGEIETGNDRWTRTASGITRISPDGRWMAIYVPFTTKLSIHRLPGLEPQVQMSHGAGIDRFEFSPSGDEFAVWSQRDGVEFWSTTTWQRTRALTDFTGVVYGPDARDLWLIKDWRTAGLYDVRTLKPLLLLPVGMLPLALSSDGRQLAVSVDARRLQVWDLEEARARFRELGLDWESAQAPAASASR